MFSVPFLEPAILTSTLKSWLVALLEIGIFAGIVAVTVTFLGI